MLLLAVGWGDTVAGIALEAFQCTLEMLDLLFEVSAKTMTSRDYVSLPILRPVIMASSQNMKPR